MLFTINCVSLLPHVFPSHALNSSHLTSPQLSTPMVIAYHYFHIDFHTISLTLGDMGQPFSDFRREQSVYRHHFDVINIFSFHISHYFCSPLSTFHIRYLHSGQHHNRNSSFSVISIFSPDIIEFVIKLFLFG